MRDYKIQCTRLAFKKKLRTIAWRFTVIKEELLSCFIIAFAEATLFSVSWASSSEYFVFVFVNDLYIGMLGTRTFYQRGSNFDSVFLVDDGKKDPNTTIRQAIICPPAKRHLNGVSLA